MYLPVFLYWTINSPKIGWCSIYFFLTTPSLPPMLNIERGKYELYSRWWMKGMSEGWRRRNLLQTLSPYNWKGCNSEKLDNFHWHSLCYNVSPGLLDCKAHALHSPWYQVTSKRNTKLERGTIVPKQKRGKPPGSFYGTSITQIIQRSLGAIWSQDPKQKLLRNNKLVLEEWGWRYGTGRKF